MVNKKLSSQ